MKYLTITPGIAGILSILLLINLNSCTDLEVEVFDEVIESEFTPTEDDLISLIAPVYTPLRMFAGWQGYFDLQEESADHIITPVRPNGWYDGGIYQRMHWHKWTIQEWPPTNLWNSCYSGINAANRVLMQLETGTIPVASGKEAIIAELKTTRAFYYWLLCDSHGNVPIVTDFAATEPPTQNTRKEVYDFVIKELTENIPQLPEEAGLSMYGRFNKWAGKALLAKVYLNAEVYTGTAEWDKCIEACNDVIAAAEQGAYALEARYSDIFKTDNEGSSELIFAIPYDDIFATQNIIHMKTLDPIMQRVYPMQVQPWGGNCAVPQFIDTYDPDDTRLKDTWIMGPQYDAVTGEELINYVKTVNSIESSESNQGYRIGKYEIRPDTRGGLSNDFPVFRYADILMMKAECLLRTGHAEEAALLVTRVRERAFNGTVPEKALVTGAMLEQGSTYQYGYWENGSVTEPEGGEDIQYGRFLDELGWEFAAEGRRRRDLIRFGVFATKTWFQHRPSSADKTIFPIPEAELNKNPNLVQNPGY
ncbi:putative outer membrane starch-binding protein [Anseongella ginsenosidimutans]|uniref:Putative outer membrane starch-binding protein n=1 Tax=Anseongella ginsenosidimutans TaxID=496056 RepID=A0A4R3L0Y2_9SPHI|nr:RagB/SusD family nutrient uptake outer membrane protein [Anseongella ginsenosidimutans]QEC51255.1 RagB/SusD family nutrient uptake outer membrane protein [Anseongella ginsenosidimutans]TCS90062.1 putative outer membrane starch-binding protein [Anseongella ginsenosidimutans]